MLQPRASSVATFGRAPAPSGGFLQPQVDTKVFGNPESFSGEKDKWFDWSIVFGAYVMASSLLMGQWLEYVARTEDDVHVAKLDSDAVPLSA